MADKSETQKQKERSKRYGIAIHGDGNIDKPSEFSDLAESQWGDPVNYFFPVPDKVHATDAKSAFSTFKKEYATGERRIVRSRLNRLLRKHDVEPIAIGNDSDDEDGDEMSQHLVGRIQLEDVDGDSSGILIPAARVATMGHPWYGTVYFDNDLFDSFQDNFESNVVGTELAIDAEHRRGMLGGFSLAWIDNLYTDQNVFNIHAKKTESGERYLGKELKYASVEYMPNFVDQETGFEFGPTLLACAATNHPFVHRNDPIAQAFDQPDKQTQSGVYFVNFNMPDGPEDTGTDKGDIMPIEKEDETTPVAPPPEPANAQGLVLPDGTVITAAQVALLQKQTFDLQTQLKNSEIDRVVSEAADRGVQPHFYNVARQFMGALEIDAPATITLETGEPDEEAKVFNMFKAVAHMLGLVPGREFNQITSETKGKPPAAKTNNNKYTTDDSEMTPEEAEKLGREERQKHNPIKFSAAETEL